MNESISRTRPGGFEEFFRTQYAATVRLTRLLTGAQAVAEDLAQDAFARMHPHFDGLENPVGYLRRTTVNTCRSWHRGRSREQANLARLDRPATSLPAGGEEMLDAINRLSYRQRQVVVLRYWLDLTEADIADALGCRAGTVKSLHARALVHLRKELPR